MYGGDRRIRVSSSEPEKIFWLKGVNLASGK
jgi:hypothetical protein